MGRVQSDYLPGGVHQDDIDAQLAEECPGCDGPLDCDGYCDRCEVNWGDQDEPDPDEGWDSRYDN